MPDTGLGPLYILALVYITNHKVRYYHFTYEDIDMQAFSMITGLINGLDSLLILIGSWLVCWFCLAKGWLWQTYIVSPLWQA